MNRQTEKRRSPRLKSQTSLAVLTNTQTRKKKVKNKYKKRRIFFASEDID